MPNGALNPDATGRLRTFKGIRAGLALIAIGISIAIIFSGLQEHLHDLKTSVFSLSASDMIALTTGVVGTLALSTIYHTLLLRSLEAHTVPPARVAHAYALSQIVRYVPGKVVGVIFQVSMLDGNVRPASVLAALIVQTAHDYAWTFAFCGLLLWALLSQSLWPLLLFPLLVLIAHGTHKHRLSQKLMVKLPWIGRRIAIRGDAALDHSPLALTCTLLATWVPMLVGMWLAFIPLLGTHKSLLAGLLYLVAAIVSLAVFVVPSGLVVREAVFLWLGGLVALPADKLLFMAVVIRIAMTIAEIATLLLFAMIDACENRRSGSGASR